MIDARHGWNKSFKPVIIGFVLSVFLICASYYLVMNNVITGWTLTLTLMALAFVQTLVQLVFFLHLGNESRPRWNLMIFLFTVLMIAILVIGSIWIMYNLDYNMMPAMNEM